ncbi:MAG: hypothetical protein U0804_17970 [Gemmataceae bacterium]
MTSFYTPPDLTSVLVVIRWEGDRASWKELAGLRSFVPEFAGLGLSEVRERVGDQTGWELGDYPGGYARNELRRIATGHGLRLEFIDL